MSHLELWTASARGKAWLIYIFIDRLQLFKAMNTQHRGFQWKRERQVAARGGVEVTELSENRDISNVIKLWRNFWMKSFQKAQTTTSKCCPYVEQVCFYGTKLMMFLKDALLLWPTRPESLLTYRFISFKKETLYSLNCRDLINKIRLNSYIQKIKQETIDMS